MPLLICREPFLIWAYKRERKQEGEQAIWAEAHQTHDRQREPETIFPSDAGLLFSVWFYAHFSHKGREKEKHTESNYLSAVSDIGPSHGGTCPYRDIQIGSNGTHFAVPKPCAACSSCEVKASVSAEPAVSRAAFKELWVAQAFFLGKAEGTIEGGRSVRPPGARASMTQAQLCSCKVVETGKNVPELFWVSAWLAVLNILITYGIFSIPNLI